MVASTNQKSSQRWRASLWSEIETGTELKSNPLNILRGLFFFRLTKISHVSYWKRFLIWRSTEFLAHYSWAPRRVLSLGLPDLSFLPAAAAGLQAAILLLQSSKIQEIWPHWYNAKLLGMKIWNYWWGQLFVYFQLLVYFSQISHSDAFKTETAQSKYALKENISLLYETKELRKIGTEKWSAQMPQATERISLFFLLDWYWMRKRRVRKKWSFRVISHGESSLLPIGVRVRRPDLYLLLRAFASFSHIYRAAP